MLLRVSSPESLQVFLESKPGMEFLRSIERNPKEAWHGIIRSAQTGTTFGVLGLGMLVCHFAFREVEVPLPFSFGALILAAAFGSSAVVSLALHRRAGLLPNGRE
jgi:RNA polymerase sigma-70 factor (ECF subfamily)